MKKEEKKERDLVIDGLTVVSLKYGIKKVKSKTGKTYEAEEPTYQLSLKGDVPYEDIYAFDEVGEKWTPSWYKKQDGYINLATKYDVPVRREGHDITLSEWLDEQSEKGYSVNRSIVRIKIRQKEGVVYPVAVIVLEDGDPADPFEGMDD